MKVAAIASCLDDKYNIFQSFYIILFQDIKMIARGLSILLLITIPTHIIAYKSGAPETVCDSMIPDHHSTPKTTPSPYTISVSKNSIKAGESVQVTLAGAKNTQFKGYFIQARVGNTPIGKFDKGAEINLVNCGGGVAEVHSKLQSAPLKYAGKLCAALGRNPDIKVLCFVDKYLQGENVVLPEEISPELTAATHTDNNDKGKITLTWTAPDGLSESVKFR
ncbi:hypothetical protein ANN_20029 [Periplaneta americana]|uniref:Reelin domain-containing protein n=1 Tax=Periplaneta americana TaxID=6978 RepID=A0ABQ8SBW2_PERAM|nr:hypothetical protein ANN_20029 [Periplaneta americana]